MLQKLADANVQKRHGSVTPLHTAAARGHTEIVQLLLEHNANPVAVGNRPHWTPLFFAQEKGYTEIIAMLQAAMNTVEYLAAEEQGGDLSIT